MKTMPSKAVINIWGIILIIAIIVLLVSAWYLATNSDPAKNILLGVLGSLIASVVFQAIINYGDTPEGNAAREMRRNLEQLESIRRNVQEREQAGILSVTDKYKHQHEFWFGILQRTDLRLDMMGNALSGWVAQSYRQRLRENILRILNNGGEVRIVFMHINSEIANKKTELFERQYKKEIGTFLKLLIEIREEVRKAGKQEKLKIRHTGINSGINFSYMFIRTDKELYVSPYFTAKKSHHPLVISIDPGSAFGEGYVEDFEKVFDLSEKTADESQSSSSA